MLSMFFTALVLIAQPSVTEEVNKVEWTEEDTKKLEELRREATRIYEERKRSKQLLGKRGCPFDLGTRWNMECA